MWLAVEPSGVPGFDSSRLYQWGIQEIVEGGPGGGHISHDQKMKSGRKNTISVKYNYAQNNDSRGALASSAPSLDPPLVSINCGI
jgi:hypothetical protein